MLADFSFTPKPPSQALRQRVALIQGPPGTGKTRTACRLIAAAVRIAAAKNMVREGRTAGKGAKGGEGAKGGAGAGAKREHERVLAVANSNVAADNLVEGLLALGLSVVRVGRPVSVREEFRNLTLEARIDDDGRLAKAKGRTQTVASKLSDARASEGGSVKGLSKTKQARVGQAIS